MRCALAAALSIVMVAGLTGVTAAQEYGDQPVVVVTLSNRADLISGGDALVEVVVPDGVDAADIHVMVGQSDVTGRFALRDDGRFIGLVDAMAVGVNRIVATRPDGSGAYLDVTNHPIGGPVFSGPQVEPWLCETDAAGLGPAADADCNAPTVVEWFYMPQGGEGFQPYDPDNPPGDVATTTTDQGVEVPYVVRRETGTINRGIYRTAVLADPAQEAVPWAPSPWNGKLYYLFSGGAAPNHRQGSSPVEVLVDDALSRGFVVATATLNIFGQNTNTVTSGETALMVKERVIEQLGEIRYTLSTGGSGGSMQQQVIANAYPGLLDGIIPEASFMDLHTTNLEVSDCGLLDRYYAETSPHLWGAEAQQTAVNGHASVGPCRAWDTAFNIDATWMDPRVGCLGGTANPVPLTPEADWVYDPATNPDGARCTIHDYQVALFGRREADGFANRPFDNVGLQYGLAALEAGDILPEQFVDLNERIGGWDIDYGWKPERSVADPFALETAYRTGQVNDAIRLGSVPMVDLRPTGNHEIHTDFRSWAMRARLDAANGHHDNHVIWTSPNPLIADPASQAAAFVLMDQWLSTIEADTSGATIADKVVANRPAAAIDACWFAGQEVTDEAACAAAFPYYGNPRIAAGGPFTNEVMKCRFKPLDPADYGVQFTAEQWARLQAAFPDGVCDYSLPGIAQQPSIPWLTFLADDGTAIPGGEPLGDPPVSVPFGPEGPPALVTRHGGAGRVETAVAVSSLGVDAAGTVVLAREDDYADALAGAPLAVQLGAPLLLTSSDELTQATAEEIARLGATEAVLLGGEAALSGQVAADLDEAGVSMRRLAGADRYATAAAVAAELPRQGRVLLAVGDAFPDALAASGLGAATATPVLLTRPDDLPETTAALLSGDVDATIVGGEAAVGGHVARSVDDLAGDVTRVAGATRYGTSAAVADAVLAAGVTPSTVWVATTADFPDALVAGAAAGRDRGVLLLIDGSDLAASPETRAWLAAHRGAVAHIRISGGDAAISPAVEDALRTSTQRSDRQARQHTSVPYS